MYPLCICVRERVVWCEDAGSIIAGTVAGACVRSCVDAGVRVCVGANAILFFVYLCGTCVYAEK